MPQSSNPMSPMRFAFATSLRRYLAGAAVWRNQAVFGFDPFIRVTKRTCALRYGSKFHRLELQSNPKAKSSFGNFVELLILLEPATRLELVTY